MSPTSQAIPARPRRGLLPLLVSLFAAGLPAACVNQDREVQTYREVLDAGLPRPKPLGAAEALSLERAFALANADNEQLASQGENYLQALIDKNRAVAAFLPTVSFQPNFTIEQAPSGPGSAAPPGAPSPSAAAAAASAGGFVQNGDTLRRLEAPVVGAMNLSYGSATGYEGAKMAVVRQRQLLLDAQSTVLLNVAQTYYQVLISTRQVEVLRHSLALQEARVRDVRARFNARLALGLEVSQAESDEASTRTRLTQASNDVRNGRRTLALLIGAPQVDGPLADEIDPPGRPGPEAEYVARAAAHRQDLAAADAAVKEARYAVDSAVSEYYPSVSLNVAGFLYRENYADSTKWDGVLLANLPVFSAGTIRADVRTAWSQLRQAALFQSYLRRGIEQEVRTAYDNFVTSGTELADLQREVRASSDAYRQAVELERNGLAIPLDVLAAQDALLNAQLQCASESFTRAILYLDLIRATGDLNPETPEKLKPPVTGES